MWPLRMCVKGQGAVFCARDDLNISETVDVQYWDLHTHNIYRDYTEWCKKTKDIQ